MSRSKKAALSHDKGTSLIPTFGDKMMREQILRSMFDTSGFGLEVGPSYNPLLPKSAGYNVETIDHADAETLRKKYHDRAAKIEEVNYINDGGSILKAIGKPGIYDFIFASHVIEHIPDIVGFLRDCETLLKPTGCLVLAIPDKRYCFDVFRPLSTVGQAMQAFHEKRGRHAPSIIYDHAHYVAFKQGKITWADPSFDDVAPIRSAQQAKATFDQYLTATQYHDAHAWQFTPSSFRFLAKTLATNGSIKLGERDFRTNSQGQGNPMHEFYIVLSRNSPPLGVPDATLLKAAEAELREISVSLVKPTDNTDTKELTELRASLASAQTELELAKAQIGTILSSTSWRVTKPIRALKSAFNTKAH